MRGLAAVAMPPFPLLALALLAAAPAPAQNAIGPGEREFQRCFSCHDVAADAPTLQGPGLHGVFGRRAGARADFEYSAAMKAAGARGLTWNADTLDRYLEDPAALVPGGRMEGVWIREPERRRALIEWLAGATR
jgi:cytochrome c